MSYIFLETESEVECKRRIFSGCECFIFIVCVIATGLSPWENIVGKIKMGNSKHWLSFVGNCIPPSRNDQDVTIEWAIFVGSIMDIIFINSGELITKMIKLKSN